MDMKHTLAAIREMDLKVAREYVALQGETRDMTIDGAKMSALAQQDVEGNADAVEIECEDVSMDVPKI